MSKRMPSQTPDHSFVGHLHPTHFLLYPVIASQKEVFSQKLPKRKKKKGHFLLLEQMLDIFFCFGNSTKACYFESGQFLVFQGYSFGHQQCILLLRSTSEGKVAGE